LIAKPRVLREDAGSRLVHLPTHPEHFYDIQRIEFDREVEVPTESACQVMSLIEGSAVIVEAGGLRQRFSYAETFVVPAAAGSFRLINEGEAPARVVKAFVKPGRGPL
jgi:hypothetical protein